MPEKMKAMQLEMQVGSIVTDKGSAKLVNAVANGEKVDIKYLVIGDGNGDYYEPTTDQTELKNQCWQGDITGYEISKDDEKQIIIKAYVPSDVGHFFMREMGVKDADGDLIAVSNTSSVEFVPSSTGEILGMTVTFYIQFRSNEIGAVNIVIQPLDQEKFKQEILGEVDSKLEDKVSKSPGKSLVDDSKIAQIDTNKQSIESLQNDKVSKEQGKSLVSDTDITQITTNKTSIEEMLKTIQTLATQTSLNEVIALVNKIGTFKTVTTKDQLPTLKEEAKVGDTYIISDDNDHWYVFCGEDQAGHNGINEDGWYDCGFHIDLSNFAQKDAVEALQTSLDDIKKDIGDFNTALEALL